MGSSGEKGHIMGAQDSSGDIEEECESLGGSLELYREILGRGVGVEDAGRDVNTEGAAGSQERTCPKTLLQ